MNYHPLNPQQKYVLGEVYRAIDSWGAISRWEPERVLGPIHCCTQCQCVYIRGKARTAFETVLKEARGSDEFSGIFACWSGDGDIVGLFGVLNNSDKLVLLGEYAVKGRLPSYHDRLAKLRNRYRAYWPGRLLLMVMFIVGIYLGVLLFRGGSDPSPWVALMPLFLGSVGTLGWLSLKKYLLLRQPAVEPSTHPS